MTPPSSKAPRIVVDTNILIGAAYRPGSFSGQIVAACRDGRLQAVVSPAVAAEYRHIIPRAVRGRDDPEAWLDAFLANGLWVEPADTPPIVRADPSDDHLFAAALAGQAQAIVTNDRPVLQIRQFQAIEVMGPRQAVATYLDPPAPPSCTAEPDKPGW